MSFPIPSFLIIGAQKSGTTSLHEYLKEHPQVFMSSPIKEPGFFRDEAIIPQFWTRRGRKIDSRDDLLTQYMLQGYQGQRHFGESSTYYTMGGLSRAERIPQRIGQMNPDMKFVYILRDPIDRIRSNYLHSVQRGTADGTLEQYLAGSRGRVAVQTSRYFYQLSQYLAVFPADRFHVVIFEEFVRTPAEHMAGICRFLGVAPMPDAVRYDAHNVSRSRLKATAGNLEFSPARFSTLKQRLGADTEQMCNWLGRSEIAEWDFAI